MTQPLERANDEDAAFVVVELIEDLDEVTHVVVTGDALADRGNVGRDAFEMRVALVGSRRLPLRAASDGAESMAQDVVSDAEDPASEVAAFSFFEWVEIQASSARGFSLFCDPR